MKLRQKSSEKIHRRYVLFSGGSKEEMKKVLLEGLGVLGWARASPMFVSEKVIAVRRESLNDVRACLELMDCRMKIVKVSGTIKGLG
jgi:RNase P/RNase MRP subunit POP5